MIYFLDTNIISYYMKGMYPSLQYHFRNIPSQSIVIPEIVMAEIEYGSRKSANYDNTIRKYKAFTDVFKKVPFADSSSKFYGIIRSELEKKGQIIGPNDLMIAATVLANKGILVTHNVREFSRIDNLSVEDWTL